MMWQEGQEEEEEEELFDDIPEHFILCVLHQTKIIRERWKFWSGTVPANVSIRLHRLQSLLSMKEEIRQRKSITEVIQNNSLIGISEIRNYPSIEKYLTERIEPKHNIIIQGPDIRRIVKDKPRRIHFWCCH